METPKMCKCPHHKVMPLLIIIIGLAFLLEAFSVLSPEVVNIVWPLALILVGLNKLMAGKCKCC